jgi:acetamidase/formamidase
MGVAPAEDGEFRTRPPGPFGGNMDVRELCTGAKLYLPVLNPGALFSAGDAHAAQGDGEVCINGIECPAEVSLRFRVHRRSGSPDRWSSLRNRALPTRLPMHGSWSSPAQTHCRPRALPPCAWWSCSIARWSFAPVHAYLLCSVAMKLRISQVVNEPMITVSAAMPKCVLPARKMF